MAKKNINWDKFKALAPQILECIGDEAEGENPDVPKSEDNNSKATEWGQADSQSNDSKQSDVVDFIGGELGDTAKGDGEEKKKKTSKDASLAMMGSMLASKLGKSAIN